MKRKQVKSIQTFKFKIGNNLNLTPDKIFLFWKGRVALYAILKAIGLNKGDEVILPAFTCVVAVNPIIYLGARPVYIDIDPKTYNIDVSKIKGKITPETRIILAQNTFGLAPDFDGIFEAADKYNLMVIEDCAHGFGGTYKGKPNGTHALASFFSSQWNKPFSTGLGGYAITKDHNIAEKLREMEESFLKPSLKDVTVLKALLFVRERLNAGLYWPAIKIYRWLSKNNLILGSSQGEELERPVKPEGFEKGFSKIQAKKGIEELSGPGIGGFVDQDKKKKKLNGEKGKFDKVIENRKKTTNLYKKILLELDISPPYEPEYAEHIYLKFPLLVKDRAKFFQRAEKEKIEIGDWFLSTIHPITKNFELWHYKWGGNHIAEKISCHIVNLPTHTKIDEIYVDKISKFLKRNRDNIYNSHIQLFD